jgi:hypothetical protein
MAAAPEHWARRAHFAPLIASGKGEGRSGFAGERPAEGSDFDTEPGHVERAHLFAMPAVVGEELAGDVSLLQ